MLSMILPTIVLMPLAVGIGLLLARRCCLTDAVGEAIGLITASVLLMLSILGYVAVGWGTGDVESGAVIVPRLEFAPSWLSLRLPSVIATAPSGWQLSLGLDGIGLSMVVLTAIVTLSVLVVARSTVTHDRSDFGAWTLFAVSGLMLVFTSMDLILFYIGFELALIPLFALIAFWGDKGADLAAKRFVLYTLAGSIPMILGILGIAGLYTNQNEWTASLPELSKRAAASASDFSLLRDQTWILSFLVLGLGIKMALIPFHTWIPKTYGSCHATAGAFLAAVVLKLGLFGFVRLALPMVPLACEKYGPTVLGTLGAIAIVVGALMALAQTDLRRLLAYSSLSHVGFVTMGLFALNEEGISGGLLQMFNHGITTAAAFLAASCIISRRGTSELNHGSRGLATLYPKLSAFMIFFLVAGAGAPGLNNFVGETLTLTAMIARQPLVAALGALGIVLGAWYSFRLIQNLLFGEEVLDRHNESARSKSKGDIGVFEKGVFGFFSVLCLVIGIYPQAAINVIARDARQLGQVSSVAERSSLTISSVGGNHD